MSFSLCSDELVEIVFRHMDFAKQCELRRCCRRWNRLLQSPAVLCTTVLHLTSDHALYQINTPLHRAAPHIVQLVVIAAAGVSIRDWVQRSLQHSYIPDQGPLWPVGTFPAGRLHHEERRLILCQFDGITPMDIACLYNSIAAFDWLELYDVTLDQTNVRRLLLSLLQDVDFANKADEPLLLLAVEDQASGQDLPVKLSGRHVVRRPLEVDDRRVCFRTDLDGSLRLFMFRLLLLAKALFQLLKQKEK